MTPRTRLEKVGIYRFLSCPILCVRKVLSEPSTAGPAPHRLETRRTSVSRLYISLFPPQPGYVTVLLATILLSYETYIRGFEQVISKHLAHVG